MKNMSAMGFLSFLLVLNFFVSIDVSVAAMSPEEKVPVIKDWYHYDANVVKVSLPPRLKIMDGSKCEVLVEEIPSGFKNLRTLARHPVTTAEREQGFAYIRKNPKWFGKERAVIHVSLTLFQSGGLSLSSKPARVKRAQFYWHANENLFKVYKPHVQAHHVHSIESVEINFLHDKEFLLLFDFRTNTIDRFVGHVYDVEIQSEDGSLTEVHRRDLYGTENAIPDLIESLSNFDNIRSNFSVGDRVKVRTRMVMPFGGHDDIFGNWTNYFTCTVTD